jgi:hypothetical protein
MIKKILLLPFFSFLLFACDQQEEYEGDFKQTITIHNESNFEAFELQNTWDTVLLNRLTVDLATYVLRKPAVATWETKFDDEFRAYYQKHARELEWIYTIEHQDTLFFFLVRDGRDNRGKANRGVGGKLVLSQESNTENKITYFEELFVTKIIERKQIEALGRKFLSAVSENQELDAFIEAQNKQIEWPDGRLFYSVQKSEWRYVE